MAIDISKAFDSVSHTHLLRKLSHTNLNPSHLRWIAAWLKGRQARVTYCDNKASFLICHVGVPPGSVLSPTLFNFFVHDFPRCAEIIVSYADDFFITVRVIYPEEMGSP